MSASGHKPLPTVGSRWSEADIKVFKLEALWLRKLSSYRAKGERAD